MRPIWLLMPIILTSCSLYKTSNYDAFQFHQLTCKTDKPQYKVGEDIKIVATVTPKQANTIRLYKDRSKSFRLSLRMLDGNDIDFNDNDFHGPFRQAQPDDEIETISIAPSQPYILTITGKVSETEGGGITFDFGKFGTFNKPRKGRFNLGGKWVPINPDPVDSLEDFTNSSQISVK